MWPCLRAGDEAEISGADHLGIREGDVVVARLLGRLVIHRVVSVGPDQILLRGDNAPAGDPPIRRDDILGRVTRVRRNDEVLEAGEWKQRPGPLRLFSLRILERARQLRARSP